MTEPYGEYPGGVMFGPSVGIVEVSHRLDVSIWREARATCVHCLRRRVLYRVVVGSIVSADRTDARCAKCWGITL